VLEIGNLIIWLLSNVGTINKTDRNRKNKRNNETD